MQPRLGSGRLVLGLIAAAMLVASGLVHSLLGWTSVRKELGSLPVPPGFTDGLAVPWHFAGMSMVTFGVIAAIALLRARRTAGVPLDAVVLIGLFYTLFGLLGALLIKVDPTFAMFIGPGVMLLVAAVRRGGGHPAPSGA
jgi:hypothetical protein